MSDETNQPTNPILEPQTAAPEPVGSVYIELEVRSRRALSLLVADWPAADKAALLAGDNEAREALIQDIQLHAMRWPDEVNVVVTDIRMRDGSGDA